MCSLYLQSSYNKAIEITELQYKKIEKYLPRQRGNVNINNIQLINSSLYVMENGMDGMMRQTVINLGYCPPNKNRRNAWSYDKEMYKHRNDIERFFQRLKRFRRICTRYDKLDIIFSGFICYDY